MAYLNAVYLFKPALFILTFAITAIVWFVVYRKKRFHGLMHLLNNHKTIPIRKASR